MTPVVGFAEFAQLVRNRNVFAYNRRLVEASLNLPDDLFSGASILDAGAGRRRKHFSRQARLGRRIVGIDTNGDDLAANGDVDVRVVGDLQRMPFPAGSFDCILTVDVVEHLPEPAAFFREAARCLRPGGGLILCTPNLGGYKNLVARILPRSLLDLAWRRLKQQPRQPHLTYYRANTPRRVRALASAAGLVLECLHHLDEISHFCYPYPALCLLAYGYGRLLSAVGLAGSLNYLTCVLRKPQPAQLEVANGARTTH